MPGSERSLQITDAYRARLAQFTARIGAYTAARWQAVTLDDLDRSHATFLSTVTVALEQAQRTGVNLTLGYLAAFIASETGQLVSAAPYDTARAVGFAEDGQPLTVPMSKTLISVKAFLKEGKSAADALTEAEAKAVRLASSAVMAAPRTALADQIATHPEITGWRRVTGDGCGACLAAAAHPFSKHEHLHVHPHCHCTQEPVVRDVPERAPRATGPEIFARMTREEQDQALGPDAAEAVRTGRVAWPELIGASPMILGEDMITQAPLGAASAR